MEFQLYFSTKLVENTIFQQDSIHCIEFLLKTILVSSSPYLSFQQELDTWYRVLSSSCLKFFFSLVFLKFLLIFFDLFWLFFFEIVFKVEVMKKPEFSSQFDTMY